MANPPTNRLSVVNRYAPAVRWIAIALIVLSVVLIVRQLPLGPAVELLERRIEGLGVWAPVAFGLLYIVAVVLLFPASTLSLVAGAVFGLVGGVIVVSIASNVGAALAFLIGRYLARARVARWLATSPRLRAVDRAVSEGGWKVVALLRLSPAVPFNLQNYLYGLTGIGFWTCVLTSWVTMLPGTVLYVYLGYAGRAGLEAASGGRSRTPAEWALTAVGLLATVVVTVYVTRLARKAMKQTGLETAPAEKATEPVPPRWPWATTLLAVLAVLAVLAAWFVCTHPEAFQPP